MLLERPVSTVKPTVHSNSKTELLENAIQIRADLKTPDFISVWIVNILKTELSKRWRHDNLVISLAGFSSNTNPK